MRPALLASLLAIVALGLMVAYLLVPQDPIDPGSTGLNAPTAAGAGAVADPTAGNAEPGLATAGAAAAENGRSSAGAPDSLATAPFLRPGSLELQLLDGQKRPIADAEVEVFYDASFQSTWDFSLDLNGSTPGPALAARPNASGKVLLNGVEAGRDLRLVVRGDHWAERSLRVAALTEAEKRRLGEVLLEPGVLLTGVIEDEAGQAVAGAMVNLQSTTDDNGFGFHLMSPGMDFGGRKTTTDEQGRYRYAGVRPSSYSLISRAVGKVEARASFDIPAGIEDYQQNLQLSAGGLVEGLVRDDQGRPVPTAKVVLVPAQGMALYQWNRDRILEEGTPVDSAGQFKLSGLPTQGKYRILAVAPGHARGRSANLVPGGKVEIELSTAVTLEGVVRDATGRPVPGARVTLKNSASAQPFADWHGDQSDDQGHYRIADLKAGDYGIEVASAAGSLSLDPQPLTPGMDPVDLNLPAGKTLALEVVDENGQAIEGVEIILQKPGPGNDDFVANGRRIRISSDGNIDAEGIRGANNTRTDAQGVARFVGLSPGIWTASLQKRGYAHLKLEIDRKDEELQEVRVVLPPAATLRLTVADPTGQPVAGAAVELRMTSGELLFDHLSRESDAWGLISFGDLPPGEYRATEVASEGGFGQVMVFDGNSEETETEPAAFVDTEVESGALIEETLVLAAKALPRVQVLRNGLPVANASVRLQKADDPYAGFASFGQEPKITTDASGWATLAPCKPGTYTLAARAKGNDPETELEAQLHAGAQELRIELATGAITGMVTGSSGPLAGARVTLAPASEDGGDSPIGRAVISMAFASDGEDGGGEVQTIDWGPGQTSTTCNDDGRFRFDGVPPGHYELRVKDRGYTDQTTPAFDHDGFGEVDRGVIQLTAGASLKGRISGMPNQVDPDKPIFRLLRLVSVDGGQQQMTMVQGDGSYQFRDLTPGTYKIHFDLGGEEKVSPEIQVTAGPATIYNWAL